MDRKPSPPSMCAMNMWCCTGFTGQSDCAGASKCSESTIRRLTITGAIPKLTRPRGWSSEPQGLSKLDANDHDNKPHGDNNISKSEQVENRPLASEERQDIVLGKCVGDNGEYGCGGTLKKKTKKKK